MRHGGGDVIAQAEYEAVETDESTGGRAPGQRHHVVPGKRNMIRV